MSSAGDMHLKEERVQALGNEELAFTLAQGFTVGSLCSLLTARIKLRCQCAGWCCTGLTMRTAAVFRR